MYGRPRTTRAPCRDHYEATATDEATAASKGAAAKGLASTWGLLPGDPSVSLHVLASLIAEGRSRLPGAVAEARG